MDLAATACRVWKIDRPRGVHLGAAESPTPRGWGVSRGRY